MQQTTREEARVIIGCVSGSTKEAMGLSSSLFRSVHSACPHTCLDRGP